MKGHDYSRRHAYMVTMVKRDGMPDFGVMTNPDPKNPKFARCSYLPLGRKIKKAVSAMRTQCPAVGIAQWVVMPDHVHILVSVRRDGVISLGEWVSRFKNLVNHNCHEAGVDNSGSVFAEQYNDRIIRDRRQYDSVKAYMADNPRRLWIRQSRPHYFRTRGLLEADGHELMLYGNTMLLDSPWISAVKVSRRHTEEECKRNRLLWQEISERGGVLASPFINKEEKAALEAGMASNAGIILIVDNQLTDRWKPSGKFMELCAAGRLLVIGEPHYRSRPTWPGELRARCLEMNAIAAAIAAGAWRRVSYGAAR